MDAGTRKNPSIYPVDYHSQSPLHRGKLALFDIDDTLYDATQREQNAVRAGLVVYGDRTPGELRKSTKPKGRKAFLDFFNSPEQFRTDTPFSGAVEYVRSLVNKGYTIAYLSGRDAKPMEATIEHLKQTGFPIFKNSRGETMVYLKKNRKTPTDRYKYEKMRELQGEYDIHYFFDDLQKNRDKALSLGVIGVYHLPAHLGIKQNPARMNVPTEIQPPDSFGVSLKTLVEQQTNKPLNPHAAYPLKKQYYQAVLKSNKPLPGEVIILGGAALRKNDNDIAVENELRSLGWRIGAQSPTKHALGDLNVGRIERMRKGSDRYKGRGIYVHRRMFGPGFKPTPTNPAHPIYEKAGIAAIQFRPALVMTNYSRILMKRGNGPFEVMAGNITVPDPETGVVGVPRTKFTTQAESFFYGRRNSGAGIHVGTRIPNYEYQDLYTHFYWPMRLPSMYLDTTAPRTPLLEDDADGGMILTQEDHMQRVVESLPPGWQKPAQEKFGTFSPFQGPEDSWTRLNPNTEVPAGYREAAGCMVQRASDGKILFLRRSPKETSKHGLYEFPGGKLEDGETAREAALIETEEEAGLKVKIIRQLDSHVDHTMKKVYHCFLAVPKKGARVKLSEEHDKFMWAGPSKKWPKKKLSHHARYMINQLVRDNPKSTTILPIMSGEPSGKHKKLGAVFAEVVIGRNVFKDVGEVVQGIYRGLVGGRTSMAEKRLAMGIASVQKELSDGATALGGNAVCNLKIDYEMIQGSQTITIVATADAIKMARPPKHPALPNPLPRPKKKNGRKEPSKNYVKRMMGNTKMRAEFPDSGQRYAVTLKLVEKHYGKAARKRIAPRENPRMPLDGMEDKKVAKATKAYKKFHGGKDPTDMKKETIDVGDVWYALGPCWSIGYMSPKETGEDDQKYIHHTNEDSKDGNFPMMYATMPENGEPMIVIKGGTMKIGMRDGLAWLID